MASTQPTVAAQDVSDHVVQRLAEIPEIKFETNTEPWYQSRVTIGAILSSIAGVLAILGVSVTPEGISALTGAILGLGAFVGGCITLYGRWKARVPLGDKPTMPDVSG